MVLYIIYDNDFGSIDKVFENNADAADYVSKIASGTEEDRYTIIEIDTKYLESIAE